MRFTHCLKRIRGKECKPGWIVERDGKYYLTVLINDVDISLFNLEHNTLFSYSNETLVYIISTDPEIRG